MAEILLRLAKAVAAAVVGLVVWVVATALLGAGASVELGILCWLAGVAFVLVVQESPI